MWLSRGAGGAGGRDPRSARDLRRSEAHDGAARTHDAADTQRTFARYARNDAWSAGRIDDAQPQTPSDRIAARRTPTALGLSVTRIHALAAGVAAAPRPASSAARRLRTAPAAWDGGGADDDGADARPPRPRQARLVTGDARRPATGGAAFGLERARCDGGSARLDDGLARLDGGFASLFASTLPAAASPGLLDEVDRDFRRAVARSVDEYDALRGPESPRPAGAPASQRSLLPEAVAWVSPEFRGADWRLRRETGVEQGRVRAAFAAMEVRLCVVDASALDLQAAWLGGDDSAAGALLTDVASFDAALLMPMTVEAFGTHVASRAAAAVDALRADWLGRARAILAAHAAAATRDRARCAYGARRRARAGAAPHKRPPPSTVPGLIAALKMQRMHVEGLVDIDAGPARAAAAPPLGEAPFSRPAGALDSAAVLLSRQLRSVSERSVEAFAAFFDSFDCETSSGLSVFQLRLVVDAAAEGVVRLEPPLAVVQAAADAAIDALVSAARALPRPDDDGTPLVACALADDDALVVRARGRVHAALAKHFAAPQRFVALFAPSRSLIDGTLAADVARALQTRGDSAQPPALDRLARLCSRLDDAAAAVRSAAPDAVHGAVYAVACADAKAQLAQRADALRRSVVDAVATDARGRMAHLNEAYATVSRRLRLEPIDCAQLRALQEYAILALFLLQRLADEHATEVVARVAFLLDEAQRDRAREALPAGDAALLVELHQWPARVRQRLAQAQDLVQSRKRDLEMLLEGQQELLSRDVAALERRIEKITEAASVVPTDVFAVAKRVAATEDALAAAVAEAVRVASEEALLQLPPADNPQRLAAVAKSLAPLAALWRLVRDWVENLAHWQGGPLLSVDASAAARETAALRLAIKVVVADLDAAGDSRAAPARAGRVVLQEVQIFADEQLPLLRLVCQPGMEERHWDRVRRATRLDALEITPKSNLLQMLDVGLQHYAGVIEEACVAAGREHALELRLAAMAAEWAPLDFCAEAWHGAHRLANLKDVERVLDDHALETRAILADKHVAPHLARAAAWARRLEALQEAVGALRHLEAAWIDLEPVFAADTAQEAMPTEAKLFDAVDETWRAAVGAIAAQPAALALLDRPGLVDGLAAAARGIDAVRAGLAGYLGAKRVAFPRFYFVSDAELLRIVADAADPRRVQRHLHKLFDGIHALEFETAQDGVLQVVAASDRPGAGAERLDFASADHEAIRAGSGDVERWLGDVNTASRLSLARAVDAALEEATDRRDVSRRRWAATWLAQVVCIVCRVAWARDVEAALRRSAAAAAEVAEAGLDIGPGAGLPDPGAAMRAVLAALDKQLEATVAAVREPATERARAALSGLVVLDVGHRDAVSALVAKRVSSAADFEWISQLRFYSDGAPGAAGAVEARCVHATLPYAYEYLGGGGARLVATPLGGRCAKALVAALQASAGCAVVGVPGAGATATVADLGHAVATRCVVVHCAPTFGAAAARAMLRGAFESGAWLVLDHGHRLAPATLAAAVAMVADLQGALRCCQKPAADDAREDFAFRPTARAFVTLPNTDAARLGPLAALRGLFRPVALGLPDAAAIAEVTLRSEGAPHAEARRVARCVTEALRAAAEHLPGDYDFGLCCVVATVRAVVHLARVHGAFEGPAAADGAGGAPPLLALAARALADTVEPALAPPDVETFRGAVAAAFAGVAAADAAEPRGDFAAAFHGACLQRSQQPTDRLVAKASQVHDALAVWRGVALVGSVFTGKTSTWRNLAAAYALLGAEAPDDALWKSLEARAVVVLPNALTLGDLYGRFIGGDGDWVDGVLARTAAGAPPTGGAWAAADANARGGRTWVVLDGAVDAAWAEHLHTALEASKLQLASRDAVAVGDGVSLLFEAEDLRGVSPGFASRVGIVHFAAGLVGWRNIVDAWKRRYVAAAIAEAPLAMAPRAAEDAASDVDFALSDEEGALLDALVDWLVEPALAFSRTEAADEAAGGAGDAAVVQAVLRLLEALLGVALQPAAGAALDGFGDVQSAAPEAARDVQERRRRRQHVECAFVWALLWAVGADCAAAARLRFGVFVRDVLADAHALPAKHAAVHLLLEQRGWRAPEFTGAFSGRLQLPLPLKGAAHDYEYRPRDGEGGAWRPWRDAPLLGPPLDLGGLVTTASSALVVPTELTAQLAALFELTRAGGHALLLHGAVGSGKTMHARDMLARLPRKQFHTAAFGLHATSTAASASAALAQSLVKRRKGVLGPPINKSAVIFVDDVNLPDDGGALGDAAGGVAVELLRDLVEHKAWHASHGDSAQGPQLQQVEETLLIVALCGRAAMKSVSARFARHFFCVRTSDPSDAALTHVFTTLLEAHFASQSFATEVATAAAAVAAATVWSLREVSSELPPAPSRPLCCFDARDAARCVEGVLRCRADDDFDRDALARLWAHEALRTFSDRLHRADDQDWFAQHLQAALLRHFKVDIEALFHRGAAADASQAPRAAAAAVGPRELLMLMFADFQDFRNPADKRAYVEVHDATKLVALMQTAQDDMAAAPDEDAPPPNAGDEGKADDPARDEPPAADGPEDGAAAAVAPDADGLIDAAAADPPPAAQARLVLFPLAVSHVSRVVRALGMPGGHALLVGPSGSGRRAAARLAARLAGCELHAARLCGSFAAWRADLQAAVVRAGAGELPVCLVVGDARARGARVLADLCDVAHTRSIPGLFAAADREAVETAARACVRRQRGAAAADAMAPDDAHAFLVDRSHARLHLVLTLDPDETGPADDSAGAAVGPPRGDFASMLRRFPGLFSRFTSVDFYGPWPDDALTAVADHHLAATAFTVAAAEGRLGSSAEYAESRARAAAVASCRGLHVSVARARGADVFRATPATFVELLRCFDMHLGRLRASLSEERRRLSGALEAVASAERGVATIGDGVAAAEAALAATAVEADAAEAALRAFQAASGLEAADADVAADADALRREEEALASLVADFERALDAARPALAAALRGVEGLPADEISALRLCARVPPTAKPVFEAVCVLAGDKPVKVESATEARRVHDFWPAVQSNVLAGDAAHVAARLRAVDHDALPPKALAKFLGEYAGPGAAHAAVVDGADRLDGFPGAAVARALGAWVRAARDYAAASAAAQPQRDAAVAARRGVDAAAADVAEKRRILADGRNALAALAAARAGARDRGDELREAIAAGGKRLDRAARLVDTLASSGDAERWRSAAADVDRRADAAAGDALVAAGALTHLARCGAGARRGWLRNWAAMCAQRDLAVSPAWTADETAPPEQTDTLLVVSQTALALAGVFCEVRSSLRANYGILLPSPSLDADGAGLEAALLARHTARWPLLLDPDGVAGRWLRAAAPRAAVVPARAKALVWAAVAAAAPAGLVVIVDNVGRADCLDMAASGLLPRRVQPPAATPGEDSHLAVGAGDFEQMVFCHASFRLYLTTAEAALPMLRCSGGGGERLAVVDFALSDAGVEREVLHAVAAHEQPGTLKRELDLDLASGRHDAALAEAQSALLDRLAHRGADAGLAVLDDGQAFDAALRSVAAARDLRLEHAELRAARGDITAAVNAYAPLAKHASAVYGAAADVARAKPAYACSLEKFVEAVLLPSLRRSTAPGDRGTRLEAQIAARIAEARTQLDADAMVVFGGALLAEDRRLFAVLLTARPRLADGTFSPAAWHFLLTGDAAPPDGAAAARRACAANPAAGWLADVQWDEICRLATIPPFLDLEADFVAAPSKFKRVADANDPLAEPLPRRWEDLKGLDRVCLVRCLRPDLVAAALAAFAGAADPPAFDADALAGASQLEPVVLIAHPRDFAAAAASLADAAAAVQRPVVHVSLAGSDAAATEAAIAHARGSGAWLIVQGAMSLNLEDLYVGLNACAPHEDFRLFVVSAATVALPAALRPRAAVVAYEAPCGLRAAVRAVYDGALRRDADYFAKCSRGGAFRKLFFALSACHALLRARRAYGAAGWPAHYEFEAADVTRAAKVVASLLDDYDGAAAAPFEAIARCVEEGLGGGIVDAVDRRLLASLVARFCHGDVMRPGHALAAAGEPRMPLQDGAAAVWLRAVDGLPALPPLDFLGLGDAAAFEKGGRESADVLLAVLRASPQHRPEAIDDSVDVEARAREVAASLPAALDVAALGGVPADARPPYLRAILVQEVARYNALLRSAKESLRDVSRALKGRQVMTVRVDTVRRDVAVGRVPACWDAYPSTRALAPFLDDLGLRCAFFAAWAKGAQPPVLWLGAFCAPRALLSAMKHHHAAKHGLDLADLELDSRCVQLDGAAPGPHAAFPDDGLYARGLALQSARWDARRQGLVEALPRAPYAPAPVVWFTCMPAADRAGRSTDETFDCPLYRTTARRGKASSDGLDTNFVVFVRLPSHLPTSHWVERGVAMFLGTD